MMPHIVAVTPAQFQLPLQQLIIPAQGLHLLPGFPDPAFLRQGDYQLGQHQKGGQSRKKQQEDHRDIRGAGQKIGVEGQQHSRKKEQRRPSAGLLFGIGAEGAAQKAVRQQQEKPRRQQEENGACPILG